MTTLIVFSHLRWSFVYQRPQHLMSRLSRQYRVIFFEEPVQDSGPARLERIAPGPNLEVLVPHTPCKAAGFDDAQLPLLTPLLNDFLRDEGIDDYLVWFYTPMALPLASHLHPRLVVYDCMDELSAFKGAPPQLRQRETTLLKVADLVLTGGPALYEAKRGLHPHVHCLPSSVEPEHFSPARLDPHCEHAREAARLQGALPFPRLGFFGVIDERLDTALVDAVAAARPDWQLVMVGPTAKIDPADLPRRPNIHWLGMQPYARLPHLLAGWDVALMPFAMNDSTRFISPTKTLEYLAGEKPVVSTPVHDVISLYGNVVRIAGEAASFIAACELALTENSWARSEREGESLATVFRSSWDHSAASVTALLAEQLDKLAPASARMVPVIPTGHRAQRPASRPAATQAAGLSPLAQAS